MTTDSRRDLREQTIFEQSRPGRRGCLPPRPEAELPPLSECVPAEFLRLEPPALPEVSEPEAVRHYTRLSSRNMAIDNAFYPLGSCTMKHNPRINEKAASLEGFAQVHPLASADEIQGYLEAFARLSELLAEISGLPHVS